MWTDDCVHRWDEGFFAITRDGHRAPMPFTVEMSTVDLSVYDPAASPNGDLLAYGRFDRNAWEVSRANGKAPRVGASGIYIVGLHGRRPLRGRFRARRDN